MGGLVRAKEARGELPSQKNGRRGGTEGRKKISGAEKLKGFNPRGQHCPAGVGRKEIGVILIVGFVSVGCVPCGPGV